MERLGTYFVFLCAVALLSLGCSGSRETRSPQSDRQSLSAMSELYDRMQATELSDLRDELAGIIRERLACYSENLMAFERVRACRKTYVRRIVELCRKEIKSAPRLGNAILCVQYCPITQAICRGDNVDCKEPDCIPEESKCIEYCLDRFWRGGTFAADERELWSDASLR